MANLSSSYEQQISSVCRGCLATERRMIKATHLEAVFKDLTGILISPTDGLPEWLCYECSAFLYKYNRFRSKVLRSHGMLCQYVLQSVPFEADKSQSHLSHTNVQYYEILDTQTKQLRKQTNTIKCESDTLIDIIETESVKVKDEPISSDYEDNIAEGEHREENADYVCENKPSIHQPIVVISALNMKHEERLEQPELRKQTNTIKYESDTLSDIIEIESVKVKDEPISSDYEDNIAEGEHRKENADYVCVSKPWIHQPIVVVSALSMKHEEQPEAWSQEQHVGTETAQQHLHKHVDASGTSRHHTTRQHAADTTSTRHNQDAEEEVKHNIHRDISSSSRSNVQSYICDTCNECFNDKDLLITHICMKCFGQKVHLSSHMRVHTGDKPYKCDLCMKCFTQKSNLDTHMQLHTGDKPYKCDVCMKCFARKGHLDRHMQLHRGEKPYKCDVCMKCFAQKNTLTQHMKLHTGDKPYKCDVCMKCFAKKCTLDRHMHLHTGDKPYKCDVCMKCFSQKGYLIRHRRLHTGDKPYKCDVCMKCFGQKVYLNSHMLVHTGDKPYRCDVCMKCFTKKSKLTRHKRVHTGDKPYKCDVCMRCFGQKVHLNSHMLVHTGDKPFKCDVCMKCFTKKGNFTKHKRVHTGDKS